MWYCWPIFPAVWTSSVTRVFLRRTHPVWAFALLLQAALFLIQRRLVILACQAVWVPVNFPAVFHPSTFLEVHMTTSTPWLLQFGSSCLVLALCGHCCPVPVASAFVFKFAVTTLSKSWVMLSP